MKFQPSLLTLTIFALFAHTGLAWTDKGWVTTYSYAGSDCSGEVLAISSEYEEWNNECVSVNNLFSAYEEMEYKEAKLQCTGSNEMIVSIYEEAWWMPGRDCDTQVGDSRIIRSGECQLDNEGGPYKIFFDCSTGSQHDYSSDEPKNKVQIVAEWHDDSTCSGDAEHFDGAFRSDVVVKQDHCYKAGNNDNTWQNSYKITCDGDKATEHRYHTSDCSDEPREVDTIEDFCQGYGTRYFKADITCENESMFDQAVSWLKEQAENLGISQEALVGLIAGGGSLGGLFSALLVYRCFCRGSRKGPLSLV